jgi:hypothetical protein
MTAAHFNQQMGRLYSLFGEKNFPPERLKIIWSSVEGLDDGSFTKIINHFVSSFRQAPLPKDFNEASRLERHHAFKPNMPSIETISHNSGSLKKVLEEKYPGCKNLLEAIEVHKLKLKIKRADEEHGE